MRLESVGKRYGLRAPWVVRDVSLEVLGGRLIRLEGPNGSGKSTLLRVAAGVSRPSAGRVTGRPHTGYVPERFPGTLAFSARDYLTYLGRVHGLNGAAVHVRVDEWLNRLGAADYAGTPLRSLSKGMCQKVALAQALLARPGLLVLDEAWTGLDQAARGVLDAAVTERLADGGAVMFVDHDQARLAGQISERWQLARGQVSVRPGGGQQAAGPADTVVVIEISGLEPRSLAQLAALPGVKSVTGGPGSPGPGLAGSGPGESGPGESGPAAGPTVRGPRPGPAGNTVVRVTAAESDRVVRQLLAWDGVHLVAVRTQAGGGS